jgi:ATP-binding cassette, subfamily B, multidrug efflux pump
MSQPSTKGALPKRDDGPRGGPGMGPHMGMPVAKAKDVKGSGRRLLRLLRPERRVILAVGLMCAVSVAFNVTGPRLIGRATTIIFEGAMSATLPPGLTREQAIELNRAQGRPQVAKMLSGMQVKPGAGVDLAALARLAGLLAAVYAFSAVFGWAQQFLTVGVAQRTVYRLRQEVDAKLARLPLRYFDSHPRGDVLSRVTNDVDNIATTLQQTLAQILTSLLSIVGIIGMMIAINGLLAGLALLTVPLSMAVTMAIAKRSQKQFALQWERTGDLNAHIEEIHTGRAVVKVFGRTRESERAFDEKNQRLYEAAFTAQFLSGFIQPAMMFVTNLNYIAVAVIGGYKVASGTMPLGDVQAFIQYSRQFGWPILQVASMANVVQSAVASAERVFELLDEAEETREAGAHDAAPIAVRGRIEFKGVSFRYEPDKPVIEDLDLVVEPGQTVAVVGPTGAGKTTLMNLLLRFYDVDRGSITIDGIDVRTFPRPGLRAMFGMVLQDAWLFSGTIRENIAYGREGAATEEVEGAAHAAYVDHFVRTLPAGYDTPLNDESTAVSQGEKQLLTIARAFLADRRMLILDEATSSVDSRTEVLVQKAMARLMSGRTSFVVAHRLSTIRDADVILVMNEGRLVERGTHDQLLAARGFYYEMYQSQFAEALGETA